MTTATDITRMSSTEILARAETTLAAHLRAGGITHGFIRAFNRWNAHYLAAVRRETTPTPTVDDTLALAEAVGSYTPVEPA